jgi:hypothetical protein
VAAQSTSWFPDGIHRRALNPAGYLDAEMIASDACRIEADCAGSFAVPRLRLRCEPGEANRLVPVDVEPARHVRQQFGQFHGVPGAAAAPRLLEGVGAPFVRVYSETQ